MMVGSNRTKIFTAFQNYEERLISKTRAMSRQSLEFLKLQNDIQLEIRNELFLLSGKLLDEIEKIDLKSSNLKDANEQIQVALKGENLRKFSLRLDSMGLTTRDSMLLGQSLDSFKLLISQFKILYSTITQKSPLDKNIYALTLIVLITPPYINYFSLTETLISYPLLCIAIYIFQISPQI